MKRLHPGRPSKSVDTASAERRRVGGESLRAIAGSMDVSVDTLRDRLKRAGRVERRQSVSNAERQRAYRIRLGQRVFDPFEERQ